MRDARRLASGTRRGRLRVIERLLNHKFAGRPRAIDELRPEDIRRFVAEQMELAVQRAARESVKPAHR